MIANRRVATALTALAVFAGCATSGDDENWQREDPAQTFDAEQLNQDRLDCLNRVGVPSPGAPAPLSSTRNQMIDCMRMKGWVLQ